jgi:hypothetical protein
MERHEVSIYFLFYYSIYYHICDLKNGIVV